MRILSLFGFLTVIFFASCTGPKTITNNYLYNTNDTAGRDITSSLQPLIKKGDQLAIRVYSIANGTQANVDAPYNLTEQSMAGNTSTLGYLVDENGNIEYPQLGLIHVEGLTREQLSDTIKQKLIEGNQLTQPTVSVRFMNFRITVLGEVGGPGTFTIPTERITILEALGMAGDITEFGRKDNVRVIRENNGQREIATLDLTTKDMFASPYYRLQQNDVILVAQTRRKLRQQDQQVLAQQLGLFTSIVAAAALILNVIK